MVCTLSKVAWTLAIRRKWSQAWVVLAEHVKQRRGCFRWKRCVVAQVFFHLKRFMMFSVDDSWWCFALNFMGFPMFLKILKHLILGHRWCQMLFLSQAELEPHAAVYNWVIAACRASQGFPHCLPSSIDHQEMMSELSPVTRPQTILEPGLGWESGPCAWHGLSKAVRLKACSAALGGQTKNFWSFFTSALLF